MTMPYYRLRVPSGQDPHLYILACYLKDCLMLDKDFLSYGEHHQTIRKIVANGSIHTETYEDSILKIRRNPYDDATKILIPFLKKSLIKAVVYWNHGKYGTDEANVIRDYTYPLKFEVFCALCIYLNVHPYAPISYSETADNNFYYIPNQLFLNALALRYPHELCCCY